MKSSTTSTIVGLLILAAGIFLLFFCDTVTSNLIVSIGGVFFIVAGLVNLAMAFMSKDSADKQRQRGVAAWLAVAVSVISVVFGVCVLMFRDTFLPLISVVIGTGVALCAVVQLYTQAIGTRPVLLPGWLYAFPIVNAVLAAIEFTLSTPADDKLMVIYAGVALCVFGICHVLIVTLRRRVLEHVAAGDTGRIGTGSRKEIHALENEDRNDK